MRTRIKICGLTRQDDVIEAASAGVDAIGLVFYPPSPRYVKPDMAVKLAKTLQPFVTTVGLFVDADAASVKAVLDQVPLDLLQFHGNETAEYCAGFGRPYIKAVRVRPGLDLVQYATEYASARGLLLDAYVEGVPGGTGQSFDWSLIPLDLSLPVVLSGGLELGNVAAAITAVRPWAVDVSSGVEVAKGIKDAARMAAFIREVQHAA